MHLIGVIVIIIIHNLPVVSPRVLPSFHGRPTSANANKANVKHPANISVNSFTGSTVNRSAMVGVRREPPPSLNNANNESLGKGRRNGTTAGFPKGAAPIVSKRQDDVHSQLTKEIQTFVSQIDEAQESMKRSVVIRFVLKIVAIYW